MVRCKHRVMFGITQHNYTGKGIFVEHSGSSDHRIKELIKESLESLQEYGKINTKTIGIKCKDKPVCAVVVAVYKSEGW